MPPVSVDPFRKVETLDLVEGWALDESARERHSTELAALESLAGGLNTLYDLVRHFEMTTIRPGVTVFFSSTLRTIFGHAGAGEALMHWYATSLCNYAGLVGQLAVELRHLPTAAARDDYRTRVCGPIKIFRDKISAHFARWMHHRSDTEWTRQSSVFPQLSIIEGRLAVGGAAFVEVSSGKVERKEPVSQWILTSSHEGYTKRYPFLLVSPESALPADPRGPGSVKMGEPAVQPPDAESTGVIVAE